MKVNTNQIRPTPIEEGQAQKEKQDLRKARLGLLVVVVIYSLFFGYRYGCFLSASRCLDSDVGQDCQVLGQLIWQRAKASGYEYYIQAYQIQSHSQKIVNTHLKFQFFSQENIQVHSQVKVLGKLALFAMPKNPGEWNQNYYFKGKNIYYQLLKPQMMVLEVGQASNLDKIRTWISNQADTYLPARERALFLSLIAGDRSGLDQAWMDRFRKLGVSHILAVSGLHVGLLVLFLSFSLKAMSVPNEVQYLLILGMLVFYLVFTGSQASTWRAVLMFVILESAYFFGRAKDEKRAYWITLAICLGINPFSIYDLGFVLSFSTVAGLLYLYPLLFDQKPKWLKMVGVTICVQITLLPIFSIYFHRFSVLAVVANLWVVPALSGFLALSSLALGLSVISPTVAQVVVGFGYYLVQSANLLVDILAQIPWSDLPIRAMTWGEIALFYLILLGGIISGKKRYLWGLLFSLVIFLPYSFHPRLTMLDVGQAESMVIEYKNHSIVVDTGLAKNRSTLAYLAYRGRDKIDMVLLSHLDNDHAGGLKYILKNYQVGGIGISANYKNLNYSQAKYRGLSSTWKKYQDLLALADLYQVPIFYWQAGDKISIDDLDFEFLYPQAEDMPYKANDFSFVAQVKYGETEVLLTGDISYEVERILLRRNLVGDIEALKVAHHGSKYSTIPQFLEILQPELAIISCGRYNKYGHPSPEVLDRLRAGATVTRITAWDGPIFLEFLKKGEIIINE